MHRLLTIVNDNDDDDVQQCNPHMNDKGWSVQPYLPTTPHYNEAIQEPVLLLLRNPTIRWMASACVSSADFCFINSLFV